MIKWVANKTVNLENVNIKIRNCFETNHFTNNGKNVIETQTLIKKIFNIDDNKEVLLVCNGAMGLNALACGYNIKFQKQLRWAVQAFTFPCSLQGEFKNSLVLDIDENLGPSIILLEKYKDEYDGIVVTNCFGTSTNINVYENFCKVNNKILIFDNAASPLTYYNEKNHLNYGNGSMVSLHHTKPIGFGEGSFIVFDKDVLEFMKKSICFGFTDVNRYNFSIFANNFKMSEISCIFIAEYLSNLSLLYNHHIKIMNYFMNKLIQHKLSNSVKLYKSYSKYDECLMCCIPIIFNKNIYIDDFLNNQIEAKKYYYPLTLDSVISNDIFKKIICLPLNIDIKEEQVDKYIEVILKMV
jgi:dTDP-4-amino-4,6-dideoxygalactose transaminase